MKTTQDYVDEEYQKNPEEAMRLYDGKHEKEIIPIIIDLKVAERLEAILSNTSGTLAERHKHIHRFQAGNYLLWQDAFDQFEAFIGVTLSCQRTPPLSNLHRSAQTHVRASSRRSIRHKKGN